MHFFIMFGVYPKGKKEAQPNHGLTPDHQFGWASACGPSVRVTRLFLFQRATSRPGRPPSPNYYRMALAEKQGNFPVVLGGDASRPGCIRAGNRTWLARA